MGNTHNLDIVVKQLYRNIQIPDINLKNYKCIPNEQVFGDGARKNLEMNQT